MMTQKTIRRRGLRLPVSVPYLETGVLLLLAVVSGMG
jgi:hypothetical protein